MKDPGRFRGILSIVGLAFGAPGMLSTASGDVIGSSADNGDGTFTYSYVVDNSAGSFDVAAWSLEFGFAFPDWNQKSVLDGGDVEVPNAHWFAEPGTPVTGLSTQDFLTIDPDGVVPVGAKLDGFSFTSAHGPGLITFYEFSAAGDFATGTAIGPMGAVSVPEPCTASLIAAGASMALAAGGRRRRTASHLAGSSAGR